MARIRPAELDHGEVAGALGPEDWSELRSTALGTPCVLAVRGGGPLLLVDAQHRVAGLAERWDPDHPDSVLAQVAAAGGRLVPVDEETYALVERVAHDDVELDPVLTRVGLPAGTDLDLDALARGGIADQVAGELVADSAEGAMVDIGGTIRLAGEAEWSIDIEGTGVRIGLAEGAVATVWAAVGPGSATVIDEHATGAALGAAAVLSGAPPEDGRPALVVDEDGVARRYHGFEAYERH